MPIVHNGDARSPLRVLMIEDRHADAQLVVRELERAGFDVQQARVDDEPSLRSALADGQWDLVVCDSDLARLTTLDACAVLQSCDSDAPLVIVSDALDEAATAVLLKAGACDLILKTHLGQLAASFNRELLRRKQQAELEASRSRLDLLTKVIANW